MINYRGIIKIGLYSFIILNIFTNAVKLLPSTFYYRELLLIEMIITVLVVMFFKFQIPIEPSAKEKISIIFLSQLAAYFFTMIFEDYDCFDIHRLFAFFFMYVVLFESAKFGKITVKECGYIFKIVVIIGIVACFYNIFIHRDSIFTFNLTTIMYYTSTYSAFFLTRSNFCLLLIVCYVITLYFCEKDKRLIYVLLAIFFAGNIILTNARTSIFALLVVTVFYLFSKKNSLIRNVLIIMFCILILLILPWNLISLNINQIIEKYSLIFRTNSSDFSNGRFQLWEYALRDMNILSFFVGHGIGAKDAYLSMIDAVAYSFHSSWIDLFYEGGLCLVFIYASVFKYIVKYVTNSRLTFAQKRVFYNFIIILLVSGIGDAVALPFMLDTSTIFSTLLFITLPICTVNGANEEFTRKRLN